MFTPLILLGSIGILIDWRRGELYYWIAERRRNPVSDERGEAVALPYVYEAYWLVLQGVIVEEGLISVGGSTRPPGSGLEFQESRAR